LGIGDWGLGPIPTPQSPIPNPQSPIQLLSNLRNYQYLIINIFINYTIFKYIGKMESSSDLKNYSKAISDFENYVKDIYSIKISDETNYKEYI